MKNTAFLIGDWLVIHKAGRLQPCSACRVFRPPSGPSSVAVARIVSQNVNLCREHAMQAANELAQAAERLLELAAS